MARAAWIFGVESQPNEAALVSEQSPNLASNGRVVAIIAPPSSHTFAPTGGFECFERLHREQRAAVHSTQQQQYIAGQMS